MKEFVRKKVLPYITPLPPGITEEELRNEWNEDNSYSARRKEELKRLSDTYLATKKYPDNKVLESKMFMKDEFYEEKKHARLIISRSDTFKGIVGPYAHAFDKELFHGRFSHYFVKGKDSEWKVKRMSEIQAKFPLYMETDYSSFEGSQCAAMQDAIERQVFRHFFKFYPHIFKFIDATYSSPSEDFRPHRGTKRRQPFNIFSKFHSLHLVGNRKSGELWTSSGNGLTNLVIMMFLAEKKHVQWDGIVEGDDGFFGVTSRHICSDDYSKLGFTIKLQYETDPNYLSFCGLRFSRDRNLIVDPENMNRVGWCVKKKYFKAKRKKRLALLKAKMMSLLAEAPGCPISSTLAKVAIQSIHVKADFGDEDWWYVQWLKNEKLDLTREISSTTRQDFAKMFGIPVTVQLELESSFQEDWLSNFFLPIGRGIDGWMDTYQSGLIRGQAPAVIE